MEMEKSKQGRVVESLTNWTGMTNFFILKLLAWLTQQDSWFLFIKNDSSWNMEQWKQFHFNWRWKEKFCLRVSSVNNELRYLFKKICCFESFFYSWWQSILYWESLESSFLEDESLKKQFWRVLFEICRNLIVRMIKMNVKGFYNFTSCLWMKLYSLSHV